MTFLKHTFRRGLFEIFKKFYPTIGDARAYPVGVQLSLPID